MTICYYGNLALKESTMRRFKNPYQEHIKLNLHCQDTGFAKESSNKKTGYPLVTGEEIHHII